jgi:putative DNA-invertase from lambdoid prophage Rac
MNVELYARTSTKDGRQTPELQIEELRRYAAIREWKVVRETIETESGAKRRPLWEALLVRLEAREGEARAVLAVELSRFGRSLQHLVEVGERLRTVGAELVATRQNIDTTTPTGRLLFGILAALAQFERELIQERVTAGVRRAIAKREGAWGRARVSIPRAALQRAAELAGKGVPWQGIAEALAKDGYMQPAKRTGKRQHLERPWPTGTLQDAVARLGLPVGSKWPGGAKRRAP